MGQERSNPRAWLDLLHQAAQQPHAIIYDADTKQFSASGSLLAACAAAMQHTYMAWHAQPARTTEQMRHWQDDEVYSNYIEYMKPGWIQHMAHTDGLRVLHAAPDGDCLFHSVSLLLTGAQEQTTRLRLHAAIELLTHINDHKGTMETGAHIDSHSRATQYIGMITQHQAYMSTQHQARQQPCWHK
jgi:hypothetical protein